MQICYSSYISSSLVAVASTPTAIKVSFLFVAVIVFV